MGLIEGISEVYLDDILGITGEKLGDVGEYKVNSVMICVGLREIEE